MNETPLTHNRTGPGQTGELRWLPVAAGAFAVLVALVVTFMLAGPKDHAVEARAELFSGLGGDFTLTSHTGDPVSLSDFRGQMVVLYFGYSFCPDVCPIHLTLLSAALDQMGRRGNRIQPLFISVDPERDTPEALRGYVGHFRENLIGLTGTSAEIDEVVASYAVAHEIVQDPDISGYLVNHSSIIFVIDENGKVVDLLNPDVTPAQLAEQLNRHF